MEVAEAPLNPFAHLFELQESVPDYRPGMGRPDVDYEPFQQLPKSHSPADHMARFNVIRKQFPSVTYGSEEWRRIFRERPEIFRVLCVALVQADASVDNRAAGHRGRNPHLSSAEMSRRLLRLFGQEFSFLPFHEAFRVLCKGRSVRAVASRTGVARATVFGLLNGKVEPTGGQLETIANAFGAHPSYFIEWRTAFVIAALHDRMTGSPETSTSLYRKLVAS